MKQGYILIRALVGNLQIMVTTAGGWETVGLSQGQPAQVRGKEGGMGKYQIPIRGDITIYQTPKNYPKLPNIYQIPIGEGITIYQIGPRPV